MIKPSKHYLHTLLIYVYSLHQHFPPFKWHCLFHNLHNVHIRVCKSPPSFSGDLYIRKQWEIIFVHQKLFLRKIVLFHIISYNYDHNSCIVKLFSNQISKAHNPVVATINGINVSQKEACYGFEILHGLLSH